MTASPTARDVLEAWIAHLRVEAGAAPHTVDPYARDVRAVLDALPAAERGAVERVTRAGLLKWLHGERSAGRAPASVARRLAAFRSFLRFARSVVPLADDPAAGLPAARRGMALP